MDDTIIKTIEQFMIKTVSSINSEIFNMPYIKFVFSEEALTEIEKITGVNVAKSYAEHIVKSL